MDVTCKIDTGSALIAEPEEATANLKQIGHVTVRGVLGSATLVMDDGNLGLSHIKLVEFVSVSTSLLGMDVLQHRSLLLDNKHRQLLFSFPRL